MTRQRGVVPFAVGAGADVFVNGCGAAPHLDELAVVRKGVCIVAEAADTGGGVDELGDVWLLDGGGAGPNRVLVGGDGDVVIGCYLRLVEEGEFEMKCYRNASRHLLRHLSV